MKQFFSTINKTSTTSIIAILIVAGFIFLSIVSLFHKPADKDIALLVVGNIYGIACFVAGFYFNKKSDEPADNNNKVTIKTQEIKTSIPPTEGE